MKIKIESTDEHVTLDGVQCRVWKGTTERGVECNAFIHRLNVATGQEAEFEAELCAERPPMVFANVE